MSLVPKESAFLPSEILDIIFSDQDISRRDLGRLARVSRDWHDAALPLLWETMHGLQPLLRLLPCDAWHLEPKKTGIQGTRLTLRRQLSGTDWDTVYGRSQLLKALIVEKDPADPTSDCAEAVVEALARCPPTRCLFPNLRCLRFDIPRSMPMMPLSPAFTSLYNLLLYPLCTTSYTLRELIVTESTFILPEDYHTHASKLLMAIPQHYTLLEKIDLFIRDKPNTDLLATFAYIPTLRTLHLRFSVRARSLDFTDVTHSQMPSCFLALQHLGLHGLFAPALIGALRSWRFPFLRTFSALPLFRADADQLHAILLALHDHVPHDTLRRLLIRPFIGRYSPLQLHHIEILAAFRHLTHVALNATLGVLLTDGEHEQVAGWWPNVELLGFNTATVYDLSLYQENTPATLGALVHYARLCPRLRDLSLPMTVHSGSVPKIPTELKSHQSDDTARLSAHTKMSRPTAHPLSRLYVGDSPLDEDCVAQTTEFLRQLFPNLAHIRFDENECSMTWLDVRKALAKV